MIMYCIARMDVNVALAVTYLLMTRVFANEIKVNFVGGASGGGYPHPRFAYCGSNRVKACLIHSEVLILQELRLYFAPKKKRRTAAA